MNCHSLKWQTAVISKIYRLRICLQHHQPMTYQLHSLVCHHPHPLKLLLKGGPAKQPKKRNSSREKEKLNLEREKIEILRQVAANNSISNNNSDAIFGIFCFYFWMNIFLFNLLKLNQISSKYNSTESTELKLYELTWKKCIAKYN